MAPLSAGSCFGLRRQWATQAVAWLACALAAPTLRAGRIEEQGGKTIIHVEVFNLPDASNRDPATRADAAAVAAFVERFPALFAAKSRAKYKADPDTYGRHTWDDVAVELSILPTRRGETVERMLEESGGKAGPDVVYVNFRLVDRYVRRGFLHPLDRPEDGYLPAMADEEKRFRVHPRLWSVVRRRDPKGREQVWALPFGGTLGKVVYYRKRLFDAAGVPYPAKDWTWDDFYAACRKLTDPARGAYGVRFGGGAHESWYWTSFLWSAGGDIQAWSEELGRWRWVFDSRAATVALDFYTRLCTDAWTDAAGGQRAGFACRTRDADAKWADGRIAMKFGYINNKQLLPELDPAEFGIAPVPLGPTGRRAAELNSRLMGLRAGIEHPAVRDAAWEYLRFVESEEAVRIKVRALVEAGRGRYVNPGLLRRFGHDDALRQTPPGWGKVLDIALETGVPEPHGKHADRAYRYLTGPTQEAQRLAREGKLPPEPTKRLDVLQALLQRAVVEGDAALLE